ncbi:MAG: SHOCT domain-containing protein [Candidatus Hydrogenedentes bacterium]|nr:SHOCT domain-containing protein [Candidatus Hydrogenedentota bacterium]
MHYGLSVVAVLLALLGACSPNDAGPLEDVPAAEPVPTDPTERPAEPSASSDQAEPAEHNTSTGKVTLPVQAAFRWDANAAWGPGNTAEFLLDITPGVAVAGLSVRVQHTGDLEILSEPTWEGGPVESGATETVPIQLRADTPGKSELRANIAGRGEDGGALFEVSRPLYLLLSGDRLFAGTGGFSALEMAALERRKAAGEIGEADYERARRQIQGGGAHEEITVTPPGG